MIAYKLIRPDMTTYSRCKWKIGETKTTSGIGHLCGPGWLHAYEHPLLAVLHNPIHAAYKDFLLFKVQLGGIIKKDGQMKLGATKVTLLRSVKVPAVTTKQQVRYAIGVALTVFKKNSFVVWAKNWLDNTDHSAYAAYAAADDAAAASAAANAAYAAAYAACAAASVAAADTADTVAYNAADAAAYADAAYASAAAHATHAAAYAAAAADAAAYASTTAAAAEINLVAIAEWAISDMPHFPLIQGVLHE